MEYMALYRKYRPARLSDLVGQQHVAKTLLKNAHRLRRQGNFRHQNNALTASLPLFLRQAQINFRFAAARHPVQQHRLFRAIIII